MTVWFVSLILGAYLLGSVPASYLAARLSRGIDLRQYGTGQLGAGNLWRMTSWKLALPVAIFDGSKGLVMILIARSIGLDATQQLAVGTAAIAGHNWPVFLRFQGGRGIGTTLGVALILPLINDMTPWVSVAFFGILIAGMLIMRSSPVPALLGAAAMPLTSWFYEPPAVTLGFLALFLIIVIKRLTAPVSAGSETISTGQRFFNRLLFDRDIKDKKDWMYRKPIEQKETEKG